MRNGTLGLLFFLVALSAAVAMARYYVMGVLQRAIAFSPPPLRASEATVAVPLDGAAA